MGKFPMASTIPILESGDQLDQATFHERYTAIPSRPHQGKGNVVLFPLPHQEGESDGPIECRERLGGMLKYYGRKAA